MSSRAQISREGFSLMNSFFRICRRSAGSGTGKACLTAALLLLAGPVRARAQQTAPEPTEATQSATATERATTLSHSLADGANTLAAADSEPCSVRIESGDGQCELASQSAPEAPNPQAQQSQSQTQGQSQTTPPGGATPPGQTQGQSQTPQGQATSCLLYTSRCV